MYWDAAALLFCMSCYLWMHTCSVSLLSSCSVWCRNVLPALHLLLSCTERKNKKTQPEISGCNGWNTSLFCCPQSRNLLKYEMYRLWWNCTGFHGFCVLMLRKLVSLESEEYVIFVQKKGRLFFFFIVIILCHCCLHYKNKLFFG